MSGSPKTLKERLDWLEKNDPVFRIEKNAILETIREIQLKNEADKNKANKSLVPKKVSS